MGRDRGNPNKLQSSLGLGGWPMRSTDNTKTPGRGSSCPIGCNVDTLVARAIRAGSSTNAE